MLQQEKEQFKSSGKVISIATPQVKEYVNHMESIRIVESKNHFKRVVARAISAYLSSPSRPWDTEKRKDVNAKMLADHLNSMFPEFSGKMSFRTTHSQAAFDIVSFGTGLIIEVKSVKSGKTRLVSNATIFPSSVTAVDGLGEGYDYPTELSAGITMDVLVVCVSQKKDIVDGFAIVDGYYWGVTTEAFLDCKKYFKAVNELLPAINATLSETNDFARNMYNDIYGNAVNLSLRKLITIANPVGRINILGHWPTN